MDDEIKAAILREYHATMAMAYFVSAESAESGQRKTDYAFAL